MVKFRGSHHGPFVHSGRMNGFPIVDKNYSTCTNLSIIERLYCIHIPVVNIEICCAHASPAVLVKNTSWYKNKLVYW